MSATSSAEIHINQLHGGAFSGFGLGEVLPEIRVLELPLLFRNSEEADHVATALFEHFTAAFAQKNFVLLALNDAGAVYVFSKDSYPYQSGDGPLQDLDLAG